MLTPSTASGQHLERLGMKKQVIYPATRAAVTGLFACLLAAIVWGWSVAALVGAGVAMAAWLVFQLPDKKILQRVAESKVYPVETTRIEITASDPAGQFQAGRFADLPCSFQDLGNIAKRLQAGASFSHAGLAGRYRPLSRSQYEALRDAMIARELLYWINPASHSQGVELTRAGRAVMEYFSQGNDMVTLKAIPQLARTSRRREVLPKAAHARERTRGNGSDPQNPNSVNQK